MGPRSREVYGEAASFDEAAPLEGMAIVAPVDGSEASPSAPGEGSTDDASTDTAEGTGAEQGELVLSSESPADANKGGKRGGRGGRGPKPGVPPAN